MLLGSDLKKNRIAKAQQRKATVFINRVLRANRSRNFLGKGRALDSLLGKHAMEETLKEKVARVHRRQRLARVVTQFLGEGDNLEKYSAAQAVGFFGKLRAAAVRAKEKVVGAATSATKKTQQGMPNIRRQALKKKWRKAKVTGGTTPVPRKKPTDANLSRLLNMRTAPVPRTVPPVGSRAELKVMRAGR